MNKRVFLVLVWLIVSVSALIPVTLKAQTTLTGDLTVTGTTVLGTASGTLTALSIGGSSGTLIDSKGDIATGGASLPSSSSSKGIFETYVTDSTGTIDGSIGLTTPGSTPGIIFENSAGLERAQVHLLSTSSGGLGFGATTGSGGPADSLTILTSGNVGIGTTTPSAPLTVVGSEGLYDYSNDNNGIYMACFKARGTQTSPTAALSGDRLVSIMGLGYNSSGAYSGNVGAIQMFAAQNFTSTAEGTYMTLENTPLGATTRSVDMTILGNGNVGIGTSNPSATLGVYSSTSPVGQFERNSGSSSGTFTASLIQADASSTSISDGFGPIQSFGLQNSSGTFSNLGSVGAVRNGADNSGALVFANSLSGTISESMRITSSGSMGIGTTTPSTKLEVNGAAQVDSTMTITGTTTASIFVTTALPAAGDIPMFGH